MDCVPLEPAFPAEAGLLKRTRRCLVVYVARCLNPEDARASEQFSAHRDYGLWHEAVSPVGASHDVSDIDHVPVKAGVKHSDRCVLALQREDVREPIVASPGFDAAVDELLGLTDLGVRLPDHVAGNHRIAAIRIEDGRGVLGSWLAQLQARGLQNFGEQWHGWCCLTFDMSSGRRHAKHMEYDG